MRGLFGLVGCGVAALLLPSMAAARPVSFADSWMAMVANDRMQYTQSLIYSDTAFDAFGVRNDYLRSNGAWMHTATYSRLLKRWNQPDSQANLFLQTGLGVGREGGDVSPAGFAGLSFDWEDRRYYVSYENMLMGGEVVDARFSHKARVGIAPYVGGYDALHTWLMLQVEHQPTMRHPVVVTPLIRLFTTRVLGEAGVSNRGDVLFNLTYQF